ncbi:Rho termination factor N-terminal domain-containing protein [Acholeplasma vituli]|uniref:Rho termination factor N-terminal domain-containing protein n=1 Tax=Paracholeplasma vituli TaxID=69473 RepID=A0ABT2PWS8_9MOLU|nr:Rho termination factor N-terminal domain-containing protein [Paracholeplasma vituli]MCU0105404.1 Rho termination factor N-terminal domain-containing protein [Paracholeplasma vituli]
MAILTMFSEVKIGDKKVKIEELVGTLILYPADKVVRFFELIGLTVPRKLRMASLRRELDPYVTSKKIVLQTLSDEVNYRLSWYDHFSESQLVNLVPQFKDADLDRKARETLWVNLLSYLFDKQVPENELMGFIKAAKEHQKGAVLEDFIQYNDKLNSLFFDEQNQIDGLTPEVFRPVLFKSSTLVELREIGKKFGVDVPRRLKKNELVDIIIKELKNQDKYTKELEDKVSGLAVIQLQRFAIEHNIKASIELKKEEIIEYILSNASETKEKYYVPSTPGVYEEIKPSVRVYVDEEPEIQVTPEPEPVIEKVVEVEPEPVIEVKPEPVVEVEPEPMITVLPVDEEVEALKPEPKAVEPVEEPVKVEPKTPESPRPVQKEEQPSALGGAYISKEAFEGIVAELRALRMDLNQYHQAMLDKAYEKAHRPILTPTFMMGYETTLSAKEWDKVEKSEAKQIEEMNTVKSELTSSTTSVIETIKEEDNLANPSVSDKKKGKKKEKKPIGKVRKTLRIVFWSVLLLGIIYLAAAFLRANNVFDFWATYGNTDIYNTIMNPGYEFASHATEWINTTIRFIGNWEAFMNWFNNVF